MLPRKLLVANRGEIAIRIMRTAAEMGIETVAVYSQDDAQALHTRKADAACPLEQGGVPAYLNGGRLLEIAAETGSDALHPGYGFLSENAVFARRCAEQGVRFVGPSPEILSLFGDKARARALAAQCGVPTLGGTGGASTLSEVREFLSGLGPEGAIMIKAIAGGGGRGMRVVRQRDDLETAFAHCRSEAQRAFGNDEVYAERFIPHARHIEVQVLGDGTGAVSHLGERECSIQRRHQKLVEIAPSPGLPTPIRNRITDAALALARAVQYANLGTFEFLLDADNLEGERAWAFIEANPRLQVEHTVTEEVTGLDLVKLQLQLASGQRLAELGMTQENIPEPRGYAIQLRVNLETLDAEGNARPSAGTLAAFEPPSGQGIRIETFGYAGYRTSGHYDSLLAKVIVHSPSPEYADVLAKAYRALCEFRIEGVATNLPFLQNLLRNDEFAANRIHTRFVEEHIATLAGPDQIEHRRLYLHAGGEPEAALAGAKVDSSDPLAVLNLGRRDGISPETQTRAGSPGGLPMEVGGAPHPVVVPEGTVPLYATMQGTIVSIDAAAGDSVHAKQQLLVMEAMKMHHLIPAGTSGIVRELLVSVGDTVYEGSPLAFIEAREVDVADPEEAQSIDLDAIRDDLAEVLRRQALTRDESRPEAVARRRKTQQRTARENIEDLCDPGSFTEFGSLVIAARRLRTPLDELIRRTPADGLVGGLGRINGHLFGDEKARCIVTAYDYTVLAGTQGRRNHDKKDRLFELAAKWKLPVVVFAEGGGGRPGDTDGARVADLDVMAFNLFAKLSGLVPLVGITSGYCFAGNAVLLGCCDVIIATANSSIGMGGPAMIEGGGLGVFHPSEVGPMDVQVPNGVVDIPVADEAEAVAVAKQYLSYFQGPIADWDCADQRLLRRVVPEDRLRVYDVREAIDLIADTGSVLELRRYFGLGMVTALARIEGRPIGIIANNPQYMGGAVMSDGADKAARFMQLCDAFGIPILSLIDTPGMMVGPEVEKTALVRHCCRLFVTGVNVGVPIFSIVLRKAYGLGAQALAAGSFHAPFFMLSWPTGEFGGMGLEGAVKLGYRKELAAIEDPEERKRHFEEMVAEAYERGSAINMASHFEVDDVIDPADTRLRIVSGLRSLIEQTPAGGKRRTNIDTW